MRALPIAAAGSPFFRTAGRSDVAVLLRRLPASLSSDRHRRRGWTRGLVSRQARPRRSAERQRHDVSVSVVFRFTRADGPRSSAVRFVDHAGLFHHDLPAPGRPDAEDRRTRCAARDNLSRKSDRPRRIGCDRIFGLPDFSRRTRAVLRLGHHGPGVRNARTVSRRRIPPQGHCRAVARRGRVAPPGARRARRRHRRNAPASRACRRTCRSPRRRGNSGGRDGTRGFGGYSRTHAYRRVAAALGRTRRHGLRGLDCH